MQKIYEELKAKGLEIIAVNSGDDVAQVKRYIAENKFTFRVVLGGGTDYALGKTYGVRAYPTNYLLDENGKIVWRGVGFNESSLRAAIDKLGLK